VLVPKQEASVLVEAAKAKEEVGCALIILVEDEIHPVDDLACYCIGNLSGTLVSHL
jgi:hypothetical protein